MNNINIENIQNENIELYKQNKLLQNKININLNKINKNKILIQNNCFHHFKQYHEYQEPTSYECIKCRLDIYSSDKSKYNGRCKYI